MIDRDEVLGRAGDLDLRAEIVERDYVLGWLLAGIAAHPALGAALTFKGGACLRKCYLETYRFSGGLGFTVEHGDLLDGRFLLEAFGEVERWIYDRSGIYIPAERLRFEVHRDPRGGLRCRGRIPYYGPLDPRGGPPGVGIALAADERVALPPERRPVAHPYTDSPEGCMTARCHAFEEMLGEKIRALGERMGPGDLYDVVNVFRNDALRPAAETVLGVVRERCGSMGAQVPSLAALQARRDELVNGWRGMLDHQLPALPPAEALWSALPELFAWLERGAAPAALAGIPAAPGEEVVRAPAGGFGAGWTGGGALEVVRFAGANRLCVDLGCSGSTRRVEPYSLRRTPDGSLVLRTVDVGTGEPGSYRIDGVQEATATEQAFTPRYAIELAPTELQPALPAVKRPE